MDGARLINPKTGLRFLLSRDTKKRGNWRITRFDKDRQPIDHLSYPDLQDAVEYIVTTGLQVEKRGV